MLKMPKRIPLFPFAVALVASVNAVPCFADGTAATTGGASPGLSSVISQDREADPAASRGTQFAEGNEDTPAKRARDRALAAMERLEDEIRTLTALRDAQAALAAWNRERVKTGAAPASLTQALCRAAALQSWCVLLPATFGKGLGGDGHDDD